ncbi:MAG: UDP-N-acetylmuramate--L-alanine ligase [Chitinispirillia bacterium]|nr:UDP-N-acetylmuramate--L-alanine ligase [Chitinispirillia bacterium]MCL2241605.1 UDP-N-acetylmuramate--L-alanine ligase [Chitinispirillia bacterium]
MKQFTKKIHMAGIGGAGMNPLAEVLLSRGHRVSGSDKCVSESTRRLESLGIKIQYGHEPDLITGADLLVYSSAVKDDNPERIYAVDNGIPVIRRAEVLGDIMRSNFTVCISGTHGKTTTTSLTGTILTDAKLSPTVLVGGMLKSAGSHAIVGKGNVIVAEADEYDRSFLAMYPSIAVITNIEADHLDCYKDIGDIKNTFMQFTDLVPFDGAVVACVDDMGVKDILPGIRRSVITYGIDEGADYRAVNIKAGNERTFFDVLCRGEKLGSVSIGIPGTHNVRNTLAALTVACEIGIGFDVAASSVSGFQGVARRFEVVGMVDGVTVVDDYAHHPGEISATLEAARGRGYNRIIAVFQPHLYSRTRDFMDQFASSLSGADVVIVTDIYKARELPIPGVNSSDIAGRINAAGKAKAFYAGNMNDIGKELTGKADSGDLIVFMGAGDIWEAARDFVTGGKGSNASKN